AELMVEEPARLALRERTPKGVIVLGGEALPQVVVDETDVNRVLDVDPPGCSQRAKRASLHRLVRKHDVPLSNRLGQMVCWVSRRAFEGEKRAQHVGREDLGDCVRNLLHLGTLLSDRMN